MASLEEEGEELEAKLREVRGLFVRLLEATKECLESRTCIHGEVGPCDLDKIVAEIKKEYDGI